MCTRPQSCQDFTQRLLCSYHFEEVLLHHGLRFLHLSAAASFSPLQPVAQHGQRALTIQWVSSHAPGNQSGIGEPLDAVALDIGLGYGIQSTTRRVIQCALARLCWDQVRSLDILCSRHDVTDPDNSFASRRVGSSLRIPEMKMINQTNMGS